ncbi:MAG: hypothetical protein Q8K60_03100 [Parachlamydiaceae bacterium]|nr:hypothetical protein [Parachlamydiaceae bacterium]
MNAKEPLKRLFFGIEAHALWPSSFPTGRIIDEKERHFTLSFLGNISFEILKTNLFKLNKLFYPVTLGYSGWFDSCLFLPHHHPNVVAFQPKWTKKPLLLEQIQKNLTDWLIELGYQADSREWLPHATVCRKPFNQQEWLQAFSPFPFYTGNIHLYESLGNIRYSPLWTFPVKPPFEEIEHIADIAFVIRGLSIQELYWNGFIALSFKSPDLIHYFIQSDELFELDEVIMLLNQCMSFADTHIGCPLKAVSFHGEAIKGKDGIYEWEMIVDV